MIFYTLFFFNHQTIHNRLKLTMTFPYFAQSPSSYLKRIVTVAFASGLLLANAGPAFAQTNTDATLAAAAKEPGAKVTPSGLVIRVIKEGNGAQPTANSTVKVHYKGTFPDGKEF